MRQSQVRKRRLLQQRHRRRLVVGVAVAIAVAVAIIGITTWHPEVAGNDTENSNPLQFTDVQIQAEQTDWQAVNNKVNHIEQLAQGYNNISLGFYDLTTNYSYTYNADAEYYAASLSKVVGALYAYENMDLSDYTKSLVQKMIHVSDNNAYSSLASMIGRKNLKAYGESLGLQDYLKTNDDYYTNTTISDQITVFRHLWDVVNNNANGAELKDYFIGSNSCYLTANGDADIMCKYGQYNQYFHNAGIILSDHPYIVVVLTEASGSNYAEIIRTFSDQFAELNTLLQKS